MGKIIYITAKIPFGSAESFILTELLALRKIHDDLLIIPRDASEELFHTEASSLLPYTWKIPWFNCRICLALVKFVLLNPLRFLLLIRDLFLRARHPAVGLKNIILLPKSIYLASRLKGNELCHIHAHWASTTATMAYVISRLTGIPWSLTAHRWDIGENNLLEEKCKSASFIRVISRKGRNDLTRILKNRSLSDKMRVIHMGVDIPGLPSYPRALHLPFTVLCPANLLPVKGHKYLIEACRILSDKGHGFKCLIAGDGPLSSTLRQMASDNGLGNCIEFLGKLSHESVLDLYRSGEIDAVVLPSIHTDKGEMEGVPVSLMEAMAHGIPVISTDTGGIPELIGDGSGLMVKERNPEALVSSLEFLQKGNGSGDLLKKLGRMKVEKEFDVNAVVRELKEYFLSDIRGDCSEAIDSATLSFFPHK